MDSMDNMGVFFKEDLEGGAFDLFRRGKKIPFSMGLTLGIKSVFAGGLQSFIKNLSGPVGIKIRSIYYKSHFKTMGANCIIEESVRIDGIKNISLSDYVYIDQNVRLCARYGQIEIGRRVYLSPYAYIAGGGGVFIGDYAVIGPSAKVLSQNSSGRDGKRMGNPMLPVEMRGHVLKPVRIEKDAYVGANAVVMPGVTLGEGAVVGPNSLVIQDVKPYNIVVGVPARVMGRREKVIVPDI